ncbi:MAG: hypothetical protein GX918_05210 [Clostridiales bacterium]|jgi:hypothetical protein|nr:hypothetical protein [Clostridiales bacterium]
MRILINSRPDFWTVDLKRYALLTAKQNLGSIGVQCEFASGGEKSQITIMLDEGKSDNPNTRGVEIVYNPEKPINERLAKCILDGICSNTHFMNRGIRSGHTTWDVHVICGYKTNASDRLVLADESRKRNIVWGILEGLKECLNRQPHIKRQNFVSA